MRRPTVARVPPLLDEGRTIGSVPMRPSRGTRTATLLALAALLAYAVSFQTIQTIDTNTNVLFAYSLVRERDIDLDEFEADRSVLSYWSFDVDGHQLSPFPPGAGLLAAPFVALGWAAGIAPPMTASVSIVGRLAAAVATAASVGFVYLVAARIAGRRRGVVVACLYAFGTATWPVSAGGLWQHGPAQLALAAGLHFLLARRAGASGLAFGAAVLARLTDGAFLVAAAASLVRDRPRLVRFGLGAAAPIAVLVVYLALAFGSPLDTRYAAYTLRPPRPGPADVVVALAGTLISPNRGVFVYSPFLVLAVAGLIRAARRRDSIGGVVRWHGAALLGLFVLFALAIEWHGGFAYGNRYVADALPFLSLGLALWLRRARGRSDVAALAISGAFSIAVAAAGALVYDWEAWVRETPRSGVQTAWRIDAMQWAYALGGFRRIGEGLTAFSVACVALAGAVFLRELRSRPDSNRRSRP